MVADKNWEVNFLIDQVNSLTIDNRKLNIVLCSVENYFKYLHDNMSLNNKTFPDDIRCKYIKDLYDSYKEYIDYKKNS